jgi:hypothetical protein
MPKKLIRASINFGLTFMAFLLIVADGCKIIAAFVDVSLWKIRVIFIIPFLLIMGCQIWAMYCGMERDGDWLVDDHSDRSRRRRRW